MNANEAFAKALQHYAAGDGPVAEQYAWFVVRAAPTHAEAWHLLGVLAWYRQDLKRATEYLSRSLAISGANPSTWQHLGKVYLTAGDCRGAVAHYEEYLKRRPGDAQVYADLGIAWRRLGDCERACSSFREAVRLKPEAHAYSSLAGALKERGLLDEAVVHYQEALKREPDHAMAIYSLAELADGKRHDFSTQDIEQIKRFLTVSGNRSVTERGLYASALGMLLDKRANYDEAFAYYRQANELKRRELQDRNEVFDSRAHDMLVDAIMRAHDAAYFENVKTWGTDSELPIFIVGMPRSGSTLVEQILASHPEVVGGGEMANMYGFAADPTGQEKSGTYNPRLLDSRDAAQRTATAYLTHLADLGKGALRVVNKNLGNFLCLGLIAAMFPRARVIHCRRDPLDTGLSCYFQNFQDVNFTCSLEDIAAYYRAYEKLMSHWCTVLPRPVHDIAYEELVYNQEGVSRRLITFCGLRWDDRCLSFFNTPRAVQTASSVQVRKPIYRQAIGRWRNYRTHLGPLMEYLEFRA